MTSIGADRDALEVIIVDIFLGKGDEITGDDNVIFKKGFLSESGDIE
jgi:hypothetical protein